MYNIFNVNDIFNVYPTYSKGGNNAEVRIFGSTTEASPFPSHIWRKVKNISENWYQWTSNLPIIPDNGSINTPQCTFLNFRKVTDSQCIEINLILLCRWFGREWYLLRSFWIWNGLSIAIKLSQFPMVVGITLSGKLLLLTDDCATFTTPTFTTPDIHHPQCKMRHSPPPTFTTPRYGKTSGWFWHFCNCVIGVIT